MKSALLTIAFLPLLLAASCSSPQVKIVEANPDLMYDLASGTRSGEVVIRKNNPAEPTQQTTATRKSTTIDTSRLRLPNMENLPSDKELSSTPPPSSGGGVIARPPSGR